MTPEYSESGLNEELYANPSVNLSDLLSNLSNTVKRATINGIKDFYEELKYLKIVWPRYKKGIRQKFQGCFYQLPCTTVFGTMSAIGLSLSVVGELALGHIISPDHGLGWNFLYIPAAFTGLGFFYDVLHLTPFFDRFEWVRRRKEKVRRGRGERD